MMNKYKKIVPQPKLQKTLLPQRVAIAKSFYHNEESLGELLDELESNCAQIKEEAQIVAKQVVGQQLYEKAETALYIESLKKRIAKISSSISYIRKKRIAIRDQKNYI